MRKSRNKTPMSTADKQTPVDIDRIGTDNDPCFGKLFEPVTEECSSCGDSDLCAIVCMHSNKAQRNKLEASEKFKDLEEASETDSFMEFEVYKKLVEKFVNSKGPIRYSTLLKTMSLRYDVENLLPENRLDSLTRNVIKISNHLKSKKTDGKIIIRYV